MASTSLCFIAQGSKLQPRLNPSSLARYSCMYQSPSRIQPSQTVLFSSSAYTRQPRALSHRRRYSNFVTPCTAQPPRGDVGKASRWPLMNSATASDGRRTSQSCLGQRRSMSSQPTERNDKLKQEEPIKSPLPTKLPTPQVLAQALSPTPHENIYTVPNVLTFSRLLSAPAIGYFILSSQPVAAFALFAYAGITDLVDGFLARRFNQQTVVGTVIDPMADKTLMTVVVVCLGLQGVIPVWLAVVILGRDVGLAISAIYYRYISLPPPKTFARYWDFSLPSAEVRPTEISKINTLLQLLLVGNAMVLPVLPTALVDAWNLVGVFEGWQFLVAGTTIWSGLSYVYNKDAVKILSQEEGIAKEKEMKKAKEERRG